jgi:hypothetical protein
MVDLVEKHVHGDVASLRDGLLVEGHDRISIRRRLGVPADSSDVTRYFGGDVCNDIVR